MARHPDRSVPRTQQAPGALRTSLAAHDTGGGVIYRSAAACPASIYGIGGAFLVPVLIGTGRRPAEVAPATLASTLVTSVAGVLAFVILSLHEPGTVAPDFDDGIALGIGGLVGGYTGARLQSRMPDVLIRRLVGVLVIGIGAYFLSSGLG
jgi:hypothetical protein